MDQRGGRWPAKCRGLCRWKISFVKLADGTTKEFKEERTVEAIAFAPKGLRIAAARYNGVTLHWVRPPAIPSIWNGRAPIPASPYSPDGRFLVTTMQENALHGWKLDAPKGALTPAICA